MHSRTFCICVLALVIVPFVLLSPRATAANYDLVIRNGTIYDGSGAAPFSGAVAISGDTIAAIAIGYADSPPPIFLWYHNKWLRHNSSVAAVGGGR